MITSLRLQHFRSHQDAAFEFAPGVNIVVGPNASGKTSLLEALLVVARGGSYRAADQELVKHEQPWARLDAQLDSGKARIVKLIKEPKPGKSFDLDGKLLRRLGHEQLLPVVLFEPNHLQLLHGAPQLRRDYLDDILEQTISGYGRLRRDYARTLRQRNALLKTGASGQLFPWNIRLSQLAGQIVRNRQELCQQLAGRLPELYDTLAQTSASAHLQYAARFPGDQYESALLRKLEADQALDIARGFTGAGPHREDFAISFAGRDAALTASRGETRTLVLALKILELELLEEATGQPPLLLLDDVFSELDGARRHALTAYLAQHQAFITTTDADLVQKAFAAAARVLALSKS
jgi:DNA replication and repair protein RecF